MSSMAWLQGLTVSVKDVNGCINSTTVTVNNTSAPSITASSTTATCSASNGSITATATGGTAPFTYSIDGISFVNNNVFNGLAAGSYSLCEDVNGCINSTTVTVNNTSAPSITASSTTATCSASNGSITATATGGTFAAVYLFH